MKIIKEEKKIEYVTGYSIKELTAEINFEKCTLAAIYKNNKLFGIITESNKTASNNLTLSKVKILNEDKVAVFNHSIGLIVYKGSDTITFTKTGFSTEEDVILKKDFNFDGKEKNARIIKPKYITIGELLDSID